MIMIFLLPISLSIGFSRKNSFVLFLINNISIQRYLQCKDTVLYKLLYGLSKEVWMSTSLIHVNIVSR